MPLLRNGEFLEDSFITLDDDAPLPPSGDIIVTRDRLVRDFDALKARSGALGVLFPVDGEPEELAPYLGALALIVLPFEKFADGRAYSIARILRARVGYGGELRAEGDILPDQIAFMRQIGFDSFSPRSDRYSEDAWRRAATAMTLTYQTGYVARQGFAPAEIFELRRQRR
ncbi:MAG: DUF934 domain-containing protein [Rhodobiaceae bacterium]|nr:DUF934 domain-containing protein [Rhodobiaceae bacterium]